MFLFLFGTGPVKGFAVTLFIGLVSNMFTAVFVSRTLFEWVLNRKAAGADAQHLNIESRNNEDTVVSKGTV